MVRVILCVLVSVAFIAGCGKKKSDAAAAAASSLPSSISASTK